MAASGNSLKPVKVWIAAKSPNPYKPILILEELGIPYEVKLMTWPEIMSDEYKKVNPCGKVPAIYDPNTDITLWESGAIILYLIDRYDTDNKLSYTALKEKHELNTWLMFQMAQQGPFFGQAGWFNIFEQGPKNTSAIERYNAQVARILGVLNTTLESKTWLVGDKCTYADLSFFMWNNTLPYTIQAADSTKAWEPYPHVKAWHDRMAEREAVKKTLALQTEMGNKEDEAMKAAQ